MVSSAAKSTFDLITFSFSLHFSLSSSQEPSLPPTGLRGCHIEAMPVNEGGYRDHDHDHDHVRRKNNGSWGKKRSLKKDGHTCLVATDLLVRALRLVSLRHNWRDVAAGGAVAVRGGHGRHGADLGCGGGCDFGCELVMVQRPRLGLKLSGAGLEMIGGALREVEEGAEASVAAGTTRWKLEMRGTSHETVRVEPNSGQSVGLQNSA